MMRVLLSAMMVLSLTGCSVLGRPRAAAPRPEPAAETEAEREAAGRPSFPSGLQWKRNSAEHRAVFFQTYRLAEWVLEAQVADLKVGTWAVALDADETVIDNSPYEKERVLSGRPGITEESWNDWVNRREAAPLPGVRGFLERVQNLGGRIAIVTNRQERHCEATRDVLRAADLPFDVVLCRGEDHEKEGRWELVESGDAKPGLPPLRIVMWLGDNITDFPDLDQSFRFGNESAFTDFGTRFFVVPNPLYGSWEENPQE